MINLFYFGSSILIQHENGWFSVKLNTQTTYSVQFSKPTFSRWIKVSKAVLSFQNRIDRSEIKSWAQGRKSIANELKLTEIELFLLHSGQLRPFSHWIKVSKAVLSFQTD